MEKPVDSWVGQMVYACLHWGGVRLGMVSYNHRNGDSIKIIPIWGTEPVFAYYAVDIVQDDRLNREQRAWLEEKRRYWEEYWRMMEMPRLRVYTNVKLEELPCCSGQLS